MVKKLLILRVLSLCFALQLLACVAQAQKQEEEVRVSLNMRNAPLSLILQRIMKVTSVRIVYNHDLVNKVPRRDFSAKNEFLNSAMNRLLKGTGLTHSFQEKVLVISPQRNEPQKIEKSPDIVVSGLVINETGEPLPMATVTNQNNGIHTLTDLKGQFNIEMHEGSMLLITYAGMKPKTVLPKSSDKITIQLSPDILENEEVVITGYQKIDKRLSASSTYKLEREEIREPNMANVATMLSGKVPGLSVITPSGSPNSVPKMRIRGTSTLIGNGNPIWVIDGIIQENPVPVNPDNIMGLAPDFLETIYLKDGNHSNAAIMGNSVSGLNVNDIESITFLKDASATAIYGTSAANGVIVVTTRKGSIGKPVVGYNADFGFTQKPSYKNLSLMNSKQRVQLSKEIYEDGLTYSYMPFDLSYEGVLAKLLSRKITEEEFNKEVANLETRNTNWFDHLFQNSFNQSHSLNVSGGSEKFRYYSSISMNDNKGSAQKDRLQRIEGNLRLSGELSRKLNFDFKLNGGWRKSNGYYTVNPLDYALSTSRTIDAGIPYSTKYSPIISGSDNVLSYNILNEINETGSTVTNTDFNAAFSLNYKILKGLNFSTLAGGGIQNQESNQIATDRSNYVANTRGYDFGSVLPGGIEEQMSPMPFGGSLQTALTNNLFYTWRNSLNYNKRLFRGRDELTLFAGNEIRSTMYKGQSYYWAGYMPDKGQGISLSPASVYSILPRLTNTVANFVSVFGTASYSILDKYVINGNIRTDASNRFGQFSNSRFLPVWSIAGRWNISEEKWLKNNSVINALDLKASYGFQGNVVSAVGPDLVASIPYTPVDPTAQEYILEFKSLPYPDLRWEKTKSYNIELHAGFFNSLVDFTVALYNKRGFDVITSRTIPVEYGLPSMFINGGNIRNSGYELSLSVTPVQTKNTRWNITMNTSKNYGKLTKGPDATTYTIYDYLNGTAQVEGKPLNTLYVFSFKGLNHDTGIPEFDQLQKPGQAAGKMDWLVVAGNKDPDIYGGLQTSLTYKVFSLAASFSYSLGSVRLLNPLFRNNSDQLVPLPDQNVNVVFENRWRKPGDEAITNIPSLTDYFDQTMPGSVESLSAYYMYDHSDLQLVSGDFVRCRAITLGYSVPKSLLLGKAISSANVRISVSNPFVIADKKLSGQDPEIMGVGSTALPIVPAYNLGFNINF